MWHSTSIKLNRFSILIKFPPSHCRIIVSLQTEKISKKSMCTFRCYALYYHLIFERFNEFNWPLLIMYVSVDKTFYCFIFTIMLYIVLLSICSNLYKTLSSHGTSIHFMSVYILCLRHRKLIRGFWQIRLTLPKNIEYPKMEESFLSYIGIGTYYKLNVNLSITH